MTLKLSAWLLSGFFLSMAAGISATSPARLIFRVTTDLGEPAAGIEVRAETFKRWIPGPEFGRDEMTTRRAQTNHEGLAVIDIDCSRHVVNYYITHRPDYYRNNYGYFPLSDLIAGRWEPWEHIIEVEVKPIRNPIPMYALFFGKLKAPSIPVLNKPVGLDLMAGDWVSPYGKGYVSDFIFIMEEKVPAKGVNPPYHYTLRLAFSNEVDGIQLHRQPYNKGSWLHLPRFAPESGYKQTYSASISRESDSSPFVSDFHEDNNYFFRVRTRRDPSGKIIDGFYGKISGDILFGANQRLWFTYYLNPNSMDRNMEYDIDQNLFTEAPDYNRPFRP